MNAKFEAWLFRNVPTQGYHRMVLPDFLLQAFVREVNARAEQNDSHEPYEFRHYLGLRELLKEWGIEE